MWERALSLPRKLVRATVRLLELFRLLARFLCCGLLSILAINLQNQRNGRSWVNADPLLVPGGVSHPMPGRRPGDRVMGERLRQCPDWKALKRKAGPHLVHDFEPVVSKRLRMLKSMTWRFRLPSSIELENDEGLVPTSLLHNTSGMEKAPLVINVVLPCPLLRSHYGTSVVTRRVRVEFPVQFPQPRPTAKCQPDIGMSVLAQRVRVELPVQFPQPWPAAAYRLDISLGSILTRITNEVNLSLRIPDLVADVGFGLSRRIIKWWGQSLRPSLNLLCRPRVLLGHVLPMGEPGTTFYLITGQSLTILHHHKRRELFQDVADSA
ncbi:unnamed protein product [Linum trigynum]|uniref:Uncharacterized protein n=1 Tax=Linum trigynum TaxID=586398 RepID=A0AAV2DEZ0_9ROSI